MIAEAFSPIMMVGALVLLAGIGRWRRSSPRCRQCAGRLVAAVTVVARVGDFHRFANARQLMAYLGLVPSEHSSGATMRRGGITNPGNSRFSASP
jgi:transposase